MKSVATVVIGALAILTSTPASGQSRIVVGANIEAWSISSGHLASSTDVTGASISLASSGQHAAIRLLVGHVPQGRIDPGWTSMLLEVDPFVARLERVSLAARLIGGAHYMEVSNRHRAIEGCRPDIGCMFEAPALAQGWSSLAGIAGALGVNVTERVMFSAAVGITRLVEGSNGGETLPRLTVGVEYVAR